MAYALIVISALWASGACTSSGATSGTERAGAGGEDEQGATGGVMAGASGAPEGGFAGDFVDPGPDPDPSGGGGAGGADSNACESSRCVHGSCVGVGSGYRCDCESAFTGARCELSRFEPLGYMPDTTFSVVRAMNGDGTLIVGADHAASATRPFAWTPTGGMALLDTFLGIATGVNASGEVVVGYFELNGMVGAHRSFRYTKGAGVVSLGAPASAPPETWSEATAVNAAGNVIVGHWRDGNLTRGFRWTAGTGMVSLGELPSVPTVASIYAWGVSADGSVVVGDGGTQPQRAVRWSASTGLVPLDARSGVSSQAFAANADGSVIVGHALAAADSSSPFRWTQATGLVTLGVPFNCGNTGSVARVVSGDGNRVGISCAGSELFISDENGDVRSVRAELTEAGIDVQGWRFDTLAAMSDDGRVIAGTGINPELKIEGFVARLP